MGPRRARVVPTTVLVTGASSGIGRALAIEYAKRGAHVMALARREAELSATCAQIRGAGGRADMLLCDVSDIEAVPAAVRKAEAVLGSLDMVIANAGVGRAIHAARLTASDVAHVVDVNVRGAMATLVSAIPIMMGQKHGQLVGITSIAGRRALPRSGAYSASKAALSTFLDTLRIDLGPAGIGVTDVQPGFVDTPLLEKGRNPQPLLWDAPRAARVIADRLERAPRIITFPWPLSLLSRIGQALPFSIYAPLIRLSSGSR